MIKAKLYFLYTFEINLRFKKKKKNVGLNDASLALKTDACKVNSGFEM